MTWPVGSIHRSWRIKGLAAALDSQARRSVVPVEVLPDGIGRYSQEIESAVYFSCLEALQNVAKYAEATRATLPLTHPNGILVLRGRPTTAVASIRAPPRAAPGSRGSPTGSPRSAAASMSGAHRARARRSWGSIPVESR